LASDDFDDIAEAITPKTLGACSTNALLKAFEVSKKEVFLKSPFQANFVNINLSKSTNRHAIFKFLEFFQSNML